MAQVDGRLVFTALHRNLNKSHDFPLQLPHSKVAGKAFVKMFVRNR